MLYLRKERRLAAWQRPRWWALVLGFFFTIITISAEGSGTSPWYQRQVFDASASYASGAQNLRNWFREFFDGWFVRVPISFREELARTKIEAINANELRKENERLRKALNMPGLDKSKLLGANVVRQDLSGPFNILVIDRGEKEGAKRGMIVLSEGALAGRIEKVAKHHSTVLLLTDPNHSVDILTQRSRSRGILIGQRQTATMQRLLGVGRMEYIDGRSDIKKGDVVVTSGLDGRYPEGLPVGTIENVQRGTSGFIRYADVTPLIDWVRVQTVSLSPAPPVEEIKQFSTSVLEP